MATSTTQEARFERAESRIAAHASEHAEAIHATRSGFRTSRKAMRAEEAGKALAAVVAEELREAFAAGREAAHKAIQHDIESRLASRAGSLGEGVR